MMTNFKPVPFRVWRAASALGVALAAVVCAGSAFAQKAQNDVVVTLHAQRVLRDAAGKEVLERAERARPGEVIQYDAIYKNQSARGIRNLEPTLPIPRGLELVPESAHPKPTKASLDGKNFAPIPLTRRVALANGQMEERPVSPSEYRALRWELGDLGPGAAATVSARARLTVQ